MIRRRLVLASLVGACFAIGATAAQGAEPGTNPFTSAVTRFILDAGTIESVSARDTLPADYTASSVMYHFCAPPGDTETNTTASGILEVAPDGTMTGSCHAERTIASTVAPTITTIKDGTLTGRYDLAAQTVTFHFEGTTTETYVQPPTCNGVNCAPVTMVMTVVMDGPVSGGTVVGDRAEGVARHTFTCSAAQDYCYIIQQTATSQFLIQFEPPLPSQAPGAGGGTGGGSGSGTSDGNFILLLVLAGASAAIIAAATLWLRSRRPRGPTPSRGGDPNARVFGAVGSDRSGGYEGTLEYGEGAGTAAPAADQAYEALVVGQSSQSGADDPLNNPVDEGADRPVDDIGDYADERAGGEDVAPAATPGDDARADQERTVDEVVDMGAELLGNEPGTTPPAAVPRPDRPPQPPTPGQPGTLNLEGDGWANSRSDSPDEFAEGWIGNTGAIGSPGSALPPAPPPGTSPPAPPPAGPPTPPTPGQPGSLNLEGEGFAGSYADSPDAFVEDWVSNTGAVGSPGPARPPAPPPAAAPPAAGGGDPNPVSPVDPAEAKFAEDVERLREARDAQAKTVNEVVDMGADLLGNEPGNDPPK